MSLHLYRVLGFNGAVTLAELKSKYKELAKQYHPDVNKDVNSAERFKQINSAYHELLKIAPTVSPAPPPPRTSGQAPSRPTKKRAQQNIYRFLNGKGDLFTVTYPDDTIEADTRFFFMKDGFEFSLLFEVETNLPTKIETKPNGLPFTIRIVQGY